MKKSILKFFVAGMALMCTQGVNAQVDLGNILGQVMSSGNGEEVVSSLTSVFSSKKQATAEKIVGRVGMLNHEWFLFTMYCSVCSNIAHFNGKNKQKILYNQEKQRKDYMQK